MRKWLLLCCTFIPLCITAMNINVRIYADAWVKTVIIAPKTGTYQLLGDGKIIDSITPSSVYEIKSVGNNLQIKTLAKELGSYSTIRLKEITPDCSFNIKPVSEKNSRLYNDELLLSNNGGYLKLQNIVQFDHYLAGVVECEAGQRRPVEFYKAQAVICRTYALMNLARHLGEEYELCDIVHCQVYRGTADVAEIKQAVEATKGQVLADYDKRLINAAYHSNCGGYTLNSEDLWSTPLPYLRSVRDTFCLNQLHATWEKHFSLSDWENYLAKKEGTLQKKDNKGEAHWDSIPEQKKIYYYDKGYLIPLKDMRLELNLHSTYFTVEQKPTEVVLHGRGNGHRVGLCQEGAIHMAQRGYTYTQILRFYYQGIQLMDSATLPVTGTK